MECALKPERKASLGVQCQRKILDAQIVENIIVNLDLREYQRQLLDKLVGIMDKSVE